ncbi:MAG: MFS transporter [Gammaproteobacteria bacterium]
MQSKLLTERRFLPLFLIQFLGAFNDNLFKNAFLMLVVFHLQNNQATSTLVNLAQGLFVLPFFLFSGLAGQLGDKFSKPKIAQCIKLFEVGLAFCAALGFFNQNLYLLMLCIFLFGIHSAFFGPIKYSLLPEYVSTQELTGATGLVEMSTFIAILLGTILGNYLIHPEHVFIQSLMAALLGIAILGWVASLYLVKVAPSAPGLNISLNFMKTNYKILKLLKKDRILFNTVLAISWFWLLGSVFLTQIPEYSKLIFKNQTHAISSLLVSFSIGIGLGSLLCEKLSDKKIEIGLVPFGSFGIVVFSGLFSVSHLLGSNHILSLACSSLFLMGVFGGFYLVPLYTLLQKRGPEQKRSQIIAANNILNAFFMVIGSIFAVIFLKNIHSIPKLLFSMACIHLLVSIYIFKVVPEFLMGFLCWLLINSIYKIKRHNLQHIPETGPAVIACNHVSFVDAVIIMAVSPRPIRFVMDYQIFKNPILNFIFKSAKAIPIAGERKNNDIKIQAFHSIEKALNHGELIGIFPEGAITRDGNLGAFKRGIELIIQKSPVPVIPMALKGLWGSFFSRKNGKAMSRWPRKIFGYPVEALIAQPILPQNFQLKALETEISKLLL